ncbi:ABATE domain-containing protein, partial [Amycolatopsis sp. NPDC051114]
MLLLDLLNTTPVRDGTPGDDLSDAKAARQWLAEHGQP